MHANEGYHGILEAGWTSGVHDVRPYKYQHPWLVVHRESRTIYGCASRQHARYVWRRLKAGHAIEQVVNDAS